MIIPKATKTTSKELKRLHWFEFLQRQFMYDDLYGKVDTLAQKKRRWRYEYSQYYDYIVPPIAADTVEYHAPYDMTKKMILKNYGSITPKALVTLKKELSSYPTNTVYKVYHAIDDTQIKLVVANNVTHIKIKDRK